MKKTSVDLVSIVLSFYAAVGPKQNFADKWNYAATPYLMQAILSQGNRFSIRFEMNLAYRWIGIDYETGKDLNCFKYDMVTNGPELGFLFHF